MKIASLTCYSIDIPAKGGSYVMSHGRDLSAFPATVVKLVAEDGTEGWGEANTLGTNYLDGFPGSVRETVRTLAPYVLTCDPMAAGVVADGMDKILVGHLPGKAAIDIALWDLRGKLLDVSVAQLLGGVKQREMGVFQAVSLGTPEDMVEEARGYLRRGITRLQLKLGEDPVEDAARVRAVAAATSGICEFLTSDANKGWSPAETRRFVEGISHVDTYLEQPCPSMDELARVARFCPQPMMVDESVLTVSDLVRAVGLGCAEALNLKPTRVGGLTKAARLRDAAESAGVMVMVDEPQGADLATAAMTQLAATVEPRRFLAVSYFMGEHMTLSYQHQPGATGPQLREGSVALSDAPGLGVSVDEDVFGDPEFTVRRGDPT